MRRSLCTLCPLALAALERQSYDDAQPRLNLILLMADDLGYGLLSCYGKHSYKPPHLYPPAPQVPPPFIPLHPRPLVHTHPTRTRAHRDATETHAPNAPPSVPRHSPTTQPHSSPTLPTHPNKTNPHPGFLQPNH